VTNSDEVFRSFPAKFSKPVLDVIALALQDDLPHGSKVFDPFAGVGGVHVLREYGYKTFGLELEPEWARCSPWTYQGNALAPLKVKRIAKATPFDAIVTSPTYGNRMADSHTAKDVCKRCNGEDDECPKCGGLGLSRRNTYTHRLREASGDQTRKLHADNAGAMQWGDAYRALHGSVWQECVPLLRRGGLFVLNISDHYRQGERQKVAGWHVGRLQACGLKVIDIVPVATSRNRNGENAHMRVDAELVVVMVRP